MHSRWNPPSLCTQRMSYNKKILTICDAVVRIYLVLRLLLENRTHGRNANAIA